MTYEQRSGRTSREAQAAFISQCRAETCIDPTIPLGFNVTPRPEFGPTPAEYFAWKHGPRGPGPGRFFPMHRVAVWSARRPPPTAH
jgi:hypothetical protein